MRYFDLLAPLYDRLMPAADPDLWMERLGLPVTGALLDVGGGTGRIGGELRRLAGTVVVVDVAGGMLRRARRKGLAAVQGDAARLPFADGSFARAVMSDALHHFPDQPAALREMLRVLAPGGRLVIEEFDIRRLPVKALALTEKALLMGSRFPPPERICELLRAGGAEVDMRRGPLFSVWITGEKR